MALLTVKGTKITIGGLCGTGKGSVSKILAERLGYSLMSAGGLFRSLAKEEGVLLSVIEELAKEDPKYDMRVDDKTRRFGLENDDFVFEGRLAWHFIDGISILLTCGYGQRIQRIAVRDNLSVSEAIAMTDHREDAAEKRYAKYYGITNINDPQLYTFTVDTTSNSADEVVDKVIAFLKLKEMYHPLK